MCFHVPSFAFLTFGPAMWLTAQDQPTIGNAATIRIIPAASTTIGLKKISRIRFIFRFLSARRLKDFPFRPPIEVHHRRNTAFITVLVVETDDCTTVLLIGAPNAFHARDAHDFIGRCTTEWAFPAFRFNVCFHFFSSNLLQNFGGSSKGGRSQKLQTYLQHTSFFALLKRRWAHLSHSGAFLLGISDAMSTPVA